MPGTYRNKIGYLTYVQFMMDYGRDLHPLGKVYVPLVATQRPLPVARREDRRRRRSRFPPREQPVHAARRALIAAIEVVRERNEEIEDPNQRDWVSIITFDRLTGGGPIIEQPLTADYREAMEACTSLQATGDIGASTATDAGLIAGPASTSSRRRKAARDAGTPTRSSCS